MNAVRWSSVAALASAFVVGFAMPASAASPAVQREMTCVDESGATSSFLAEQVRMGNATPASWRSVEGDYEGFLIREVALDGTTTQGIGKGTEHHHDYVECSFVISQGPNQGKTATFTGFFVAP